MLCCIKRTKEKKMKKVVNSSYDIEVKVDSYDDLSNVGIQSETNISDSIIFESDCNQIDNKNGSVMLDVEVPNNTSLSLEKCMSCQDKSAILLCACSHSGVIGLCDHKFCRTCFRKENRDMVLNLFYTFTCPCCHIQLYENVRSIVEAILIGEAATLSVYISTHISPPFQLSFATDDEDADDDDILHYNDMNKLVVEKLEAALELNSTRFDTLYSLFLSCSYGHKYLIEHNMSAILSDFYSVKLFDYSKKLLCHFWLSGPRESVRGECFHQLSCVFNVYRNYPAALTYSKLAYTHTPLSTYKQLHLEARAAVDAMPPLRFAVGDEVEFLCEFDAESEWTVGKVVKLHYREQKFDISFTAPYQLRILYQNELPDISHEYVSVKADTDRYIRKVGMRSIEDTRYQARLDAKVAEMTQVYCSKEVVPDIYLTLTRDRAFVEMLQTVWQIELTESTIKLYRVLVMYRQPLVHTDSGYHLPSTEEVIAGIRAYFDPAHLSDDTTPLAAGSDSEEMRDDILGLFRGTSIDMPDDVDDLDVQGLLLYSIRNHVLMSISLDVNSSETAAELSLAVPLEVSKAISRVSTTRDLISLLSRATYSAEAAHYIDAWVAVHTCLENPNPDAGQACECPYVYFFVKFCLDHGLGVPKLALALYDRMNMQLARGFIRCGNPSCERNRLDRSNGKKSLYKCTGCKVVSYCSKECQVSYYPKHMKFCREHTVIKMGHNYDL